MEVLHLDYRPGTAGWVLPLQTRLRMSSTSVLKVRYERWREVGLAGLGMAVATRLSLILRVSYRLGELIKKLRDEIQESGRLDELLDGGFVYTTRDERIFYDICVVVDAFYFEFQSCYEVLGRFVTTFCKEMLGTHVTEQQLLQVLQDGGLDTTWIDPIRENRKLFFHETAPWISLHVLKRRPLECSLLVMKENIHDFSDPETYITQDDLVNAIQGLQKAAWAIHRWLVEQIEEFEARST